MNRQQAWICSAVLSEEQKKKKNNNNQLFHSRVQPSSLAKSLGNIAPTQ